MIDIRKDIHTKLLQLGEGIKNVSISKLNKKNGFKENNIKSDLLTFDFSKQRVDQEVLDYLFQIPDLINLKESLNLLFKGDFLNPSEDRGVSHTLYRTRDSHDGFELIFTERKKIRSNINCHIQNIRYIFPSPAN